MCLGGLSPDWESQCISSSNLVLTWHFWTSLNHVVIALFWILVMLILLLRQFMLIPGPLNVTQCSNWSLQPAQSSLRALYSTLLSSWPNPAAEHSPSWLRLCSGKPHHQAAGTFPSPPFSLEYGQWWVSRPFPSGTAEHDCLPHLPQPAQFHPAAEPLLQWSQSSAELL